MCAHAPHSPNAMLLPAIYVHKIYTIYDERMERTKIQHKQLSLYMCSSYRRWYYNSSNVNSSFWVLTWRTQSVYLRITVVAAAAVLPFFVRSFKRFCFLLFAYNDTKWRISHINNSYNCMMAYIWNKRARDKRKQPKEKEKKENQYNRNGSAHTQS